MHAGHEGHVDQGPSPSPNEKPIHSQDQLVAAHVFFDPSHESARRFVQDRLIDWKRAQGDFGYQPNREDVDAWLQYFGPALDFLNLSVGVYKPVPCVDMRAESCRALCLQCRFC